MNDKKCFKCNGTGKMTHPYGPGGKEIKGHGCRYCGGSGKATYKATKLKKFVKEILSTISDETEPKKKQPIGVSPDKLKHTECPRCKNRMTFLKSSDPVVWGCEKCGHNWGWDQVNEEHGDVHYWGKQPTDKQHKISTGYDGTVPLKETTKPMKSKEALKQLVIEAAKEVVKEYQHEQQHEQQEMAQFKMIKDRADQLMQMHQQGTYDESKELELVRQIKKIALDIESLHTGTKITTNEKTIQK